MSPQEPRQQPQITDIQPQAAQSRPQSAHPVETLAHTPATAHAPVSHFGPAQHQPNHPSTHQKPPAKNIPEPPKKVKKLPRGAASREVREYFVENLSMLLSTEVTVGEALNTITREITSKKVKKVLQDAIVKIDEGMPFWRAIGDTGLLSGSAVALIKVGEESGRLPENLKVVAEQMHKNNMLVAKIRSALLYPTFLVILLFVVGSGVGLFLLPRLTDIFKGLNVQLGLMTRILLAFGKFWGKWGFVITGAFFVVIIALSFLVRSNRQIKNLGERILFILPGVKQMLFEAEIARFGFILGSLLNAGLPVTDALGSLADSMATKRYQTVALFLKSNIEEGNSFAKSLEQMKHKNYIPGPIRQLIVSAEKSGHLADTLLKAGQIYEDKADITARNLETLIEPIILIAIAAAVLVIALAVILPIYSLVGGLNSK